jgi:hypothetical protein
MPSGRTPAYLIPIEGSYLEILHAAVKAAGGQRPAARLAGINQSTMSRTLDGRATYTTLRKLSESLPGVPTPIISVKDSKHEQWCRAGAELSESKPAVFALILDAAVEALRAPEPHAEPPSTERLRTVVTEPLPARRVRRRTK